MTRQASLIYMGTSAFAVHTLTRLFEAGFPIKAVITQPDKPSGRGQAVHDSPVKQKASELQLPIYQPKTLKDDNAAALFDALAPTLIVVVAYGKILPPWLIHLPEFGAINLHGSLLPKYRGAAPIHWAVANGETETGVTTMMLDEGLDTGPMLLAERTAIQPGETVNELSERLASIGSELALRTVNAVLNREITPQPQDSTLASYAPILKREMGLIDWSMTASAIHNRVRAFQPWPGSSAGFRDTRCKILKTQVGTGNSNNGPGTIQVERRALSVSCGEGTVLEILELQPENRKAVSAADFINGMRVQSGEVFG